MAFTAEHVIVRDNVVERIKVAFPSKYHKNNVKLVAEFMPPDPTTLKELIQVRATTLPYGMAGGAYLQRIGVEVALFLRTAVDTKWRYDELIRQVDEEFKLLRQKLIDRAYGGLSVYLFEDRAPMGARPVYTAKGPLKDMIWTAASFSGLWCDRLTNWQQ